MQNPTPSDPQTANESPSTPSSSPTLAQSSQRRARSRYVLKIDHNDDSKPPWFSWLKLMGWCASVFVHIIIIVNLMLIIIPPKKDNQGLVEGGLIDNALTIPPDRAEGLNDPLITLSEPKPPEPDAVPATPNLLLDSAALKAIKSQTSVPPSSATKGDKASFGEAKFGSGQEKIHGVSVKVGDPQFTLIWDTDADLDLHVEEPGGSHIHWGHRRGMQGGELDVDDTNGFGPENVYWNTTEGPGGQKSLGNGPSGNYRWKVKYYTGFNGESKRTRWKVRVKHLGEVNVYEGTLRHIGDESEVHTLEVEEPSKS